MVVNNKIPLTTEAYDTIKQQIIDLHLRPGEIIMVQQLARKLGISRTPVREALVRLKNEGLVDSAEGRKFKVCELTLDTIIEIYDIRECLESLAIERVSETITNIQMRHLRNIVVKMKDALEHKDYDSFFQQDSNFHNYIIEACGNKILKSLMKQLSDKVQRIRYLTINISKRPEDSIGEHMQILECLKHKDREGAKSVLQKHLSNVKVGLKALFEDTNKNFFGRSFLIM